VGSGVGGAVGGVMGAIIGHGTGAVVVGTLAGALLGGAIGHFGYDQDTARHFTWRGGILKKFLVFFGDFHQTDSHAKGVFLFVPANSFPPGLRRYPSPRGGGGIKFRFVVKEFSNERLGCLRC